jgi:large subunit ribosomal protein L1
MAEAKKAVQSPKSKVESKKKVVSKKKEAEKAADLGSVVPDEIKEIVESPAVVDDDTEVKAVAKAGKRSAKAEKALEEKAAKEDRKISKADVAETPKQPQKPARSKAERAGKKYKEVFKLIEADKTYSLEDAMELATKTSTTKFDSSVELHIRLGVDPKQADQNIRGMVTLPHGTGKTVRIAVICEPADEAKAKAAGADIVGTETVFALLDKEKIDFDVLVAAPTQMAKLGKYAKVLGPRGLMPNPKSGTVSADVAKAVTDAKGGKVEYRVDSTGIIHLAVGKVSFGGKKLSENAQTVISSVRSAKPTSVKGIYVLSIFASSTMGPSIKIVQE